jgi:RND family efflux transporter MFP subunit
MRKISIDKVYWRSGKLEQISSEHWLRSSVLKLANTPIHTRRAETFSMIAVVAITVASGCQREPGLPAKPPIAVRLADVAQYQSSEGLRYSASLIPYAQVDVAFRTTGYVTDVKQIKSADGRTRNIGTGDYVTRGTVLAQIRRQDLKNQADESGAQVDAAVAQHAQAEQDFNRAKALYATQSLTKPEYDQAQARFDSTLAAVNQAQAAQRQAQLTLSDSQLAAPLSGYIVARNIDVGTLASVSSAAFTVADTSAVKATFGVPEDALNLVHQGQQLTLQLQNGAAQYSGRVTSISPSADVRNRVFAIEVTLSNRKNTLKPGMIASVELGGKREASQPSVPLSAIVPYPGESGQFAVVVAEQQSGQWKAHIRRVTVGETHGSSASVTGVHAGEKVVVIGAQLLKDGDSLSVIP